MAASPTEPTDRLIVAVRELASARHMAEIVEVVRHAARELVQADGATFVLRDGDRCHYVAEDAIGPLWRGQRFPVETCISGWAMRNRRAAAISDIYADDRIPHDTYRPTFVHSLVMTPVRAVDPVAAIGVYWADNHEATPREIELLQALADTTAVAIENARLLAELDDRVNERTAELAAANRDLRAFAHLAAHDLRTPLLTAAAFVDLVKKYDGPRLSADGQEALEGAQTAHESMSRLIDAILEYSTVAQGAMTHEAVDMNVVVGDALNDLDALVVERGAEIIVAPLPQVHGSRPLLERAVQNLISNAVNYGDREHPVVSVSGQRDGDGRVSITVADNGPGIPEHERDAIFEMFTRGSTRGDRDGFGIGLAFVTRVMEKHGGTVSVVDNPPGGACFSLTF